MFVPRLGNGTAGTDQDETTGYYRDHNISNHGHLPHNKLKRLIKNLHAEDLFASTPYVKNNVFQKINKKNNGKSNNQTADKTEANEE